jgi:hypothetical protein
LLERGGHAYGRGFLPDAQMNEAGNFGSLKQRREPQLRLTDEEHSFIELQEPRFVMRRHFPPFRDSCLKQY